MGIFDAFKKTPSPDETPFPSPSEGVTPSIPEPEPPPIMPEEPTPPPTNTDTPNPPEVSQGHQGQPTAAAASSTEIGADTKTTEPVVPVFDPEKVEQIPKSYIDTQVEVTDKAEQLTEDRGESATEEVKAAEQGETFEAKLEEGAD